MIERTDKSGLEGMHSLAELVSILKKRWRLVIAGTLSVVGSTMFFTFRAIPKYRAAATVLVEDSNSGHNPFNQWTKMGAANPHVQTEIQLLKSRRLSEAVGTTLGLQLAMSEEDKKKFEQIFFPPQIERTAPRVWFALEGARLKQETTGGTVAIQEVNLPVHLGSAVVSMKKRPEAGDRIRFALQGSIDVAGWIDSVTSVRAVGEDSNVIEIVVETDNPELARNLVNARVDRYVQFNIARRGKDLAQTEEFLATQLEQTRSQLTHEADTLRGFREERGGIDPELEMKKIMTVRETLETRLLDLRTRTDKFEQAEKALAAGVDTTRLVAILLQSGFVVLEKLASDLREADQKLVELGHSLTPEHPEYREALERQNALLQQAFQLVASQLQFLRREEKVIRQQIQRNQDQLAAIPKMELDFISLKRASVAKENAFSFLSTGYEETRIARAATIPSVSVIDEAIIPRAPFWPRPMQNFWMSLLAGFLLSAAVAMAADYLKDTIEEMAEIEKLIERPILGVIPRLTEPEQLATARFSLRRFLDTKSTGSPIVTHANPKSVDMEAFRALRTNLHLFSAPNQTQVLLFSSSMPGDGKTTIVSNFAYVLSDLGKNVLILDADFRNPNLGRVYQRESEHGLSDIVKDEQINWKQCVCEIRTRDNAHGVLHFISAGRESEDPSRLLHSARFGKLVNDLRHRYDYVLFDSPPISLIPDAVLLAKFVDGAVLVVAPSRTKRIALRATWRRLQEVQAQVYGVVLNLRERSTSISSYNGGYGYGYYAQYGRARKEVSVVSKHLRKIKFLRLMKQGHG